MSNPIIPNFFFIGAMKSGTSYLHDLLSDHPEIFMSQVKEPTHFVDKNELAKISPWIARQAFWQSSKYLKLFDGAHGFPVVGESSTNYSKSPLATHVPERIHEFCANAKILYIMRDPMNRAISHFWHQVSHHSETRGLLQAFQENPEYLHVSNYCHQLKGYIDVFPSDSIYTLTYEELRSQPLLALSSIYDWLGVHPDHQPSLIGTRVNQTARTMQQARGFGMLDRLRQSYAWSKVSKIAPLALKRVGRNLATRNVDRDTRFTAEEPAAIDYLLSKLRDPTKQLADMLERDFPDWDERLFE